MKLSRRHLIAALGVASVAPLVGCPAPAPSSTGSGAPTIPTATSSESALPFGLTTPSSVEAVIFDGAFGTSYVQSAADVIEATYTGVTVTVTPSKNISDDLKARFDAGDPPDLVDNSGAGRLATSGIVDDLTTLEALVDSTNLEGQPIRDTLYHGVVEAGTFDGKLVAINYALTVYGLWYSARSFASEGWMVPATWDEMLPLAELAKSKDRALFTWGDESATYFQEMAIASAIKEGGHPLRIALDNLEPDAWQHPAMSRVLAPLEELVRGGHIIHGGDYLSAQRLWAQGKALLYPSGAWIAKETKDSTPADFDMAVAPVPTPTAAPALPLAAIHASATEPFMVPAKAKNPAGAKELLRVMLSAKAAAAFAEENLMPTVVRASSDAAGPLLKAQTRLLADAGDDVFTWRFTTHYDVSTQQSESWTAFLKGEIGAKALADQLQSISDTIRNDPTVVRYTVS